MTDRKLQRSTIALTLLSAILLATGCESSFNRNPDPFSGGLGDSVDRPDRQLRNDDTVSQSEPVDETEPDRSRSIPVPEIARGTGFSYDATEEGVAPTLGVQFVDASVPALPIPQFIDVVFGEMLDVPYVTGSGVAEKSELVQLRSSGRMRSEDFLDLVSQSLENYGIRVYANRGAFEIVTDTALQSMMPRFLSSRSRADIPTGLRPVIQFIELQAMPVNEMKSILDQAFPNNPMLRIETNPRINVLTLTGLPDDIDAALAVVDQLDELTYAGSIAERYTPVFWSADSLAQELAALLEAEGWQASANRAIKKPILIIPVEYSNDIFIFSRTAEGLARARFWLSELDRPTRKGNEKQTFVYDVRNVDAQLLAEILDDVLSRQNDDPDDEQNAPQRAETASGEANDIQTRRRRQTFGSVVVNTLSNQILFTGTPSQYDQIRPLLLRLDTAPAEVLIEVTVAEITLTDDTSYGVEFLLDSIGNSDIDIDIANEGLGIGGVGTNVGIVTGNIDAAINFFANNNLLNVLSTPRLTTRSGGAAQIQVGTDVPIITSQRAADSQDGFGNTDILQSVEYRSTGVLLSIEPIVFGDNRVDLSLTQEVSTAIPTTSSEISSPTISNRSVTTQLSLEDGATAVLGGLISNNTTRDETGTPLLKDVPLVGNLFKSTTLSSTRTELIVLITAYVIRGTDDKRAFTDELVSRFGSTREESLDLTTYMGELDQTEE